MRYRTHADMSFVKDAQGYTTPQVRNRKYRGTYVSPVSFVDVSFEDGIRYPITVRVF